MKKVEIKGMSCGHCTAAVKTALEELGFTGVEVDLEKALATFDETAKVSEEALREAIDEIGFEVGSVA